MVGLTITVGTTLGPGRNGRISKTHSGAPAAEALPPSSASLPSLLHAAPRGSHLIKEIAQIAERQHDGALLEDGHEEVALVCQAELNDGRDAPPGRPARGERPHSFFNQ